MVLAIIYTNYINTLLSKVVAEIWKYCCKEIQWDKKH